jgi:hypothetical protein
MATAICMGTGKSALNHGDFPSARHVRGGYSDFFPLRTLCRHRRMVFLSPMRVVGIGAWFFPPRSALSASALRFEVPEAAGQSRRNIFFPIDRLAKPDNPFFSQKNPLSARTVNLF